MFVSHSGGGGRHYNAGNPAQRSGDDDSAAFLVERFGDEPKSFEACGSMQASIPCDQSQVVFDD
jgi:hypothetical protein